MRDNPTVIQMQIANKLDIDISKDTEAIAAARIREVVECAINPGSNYRPATQRQITYAASLRLDVRNDSFWVASAKINDRLKEMNDEALKQLNLEPGDRVIVTKTIEINEQRHEYQEEHIVSSVGKNHRVYFKGGKGQGAWPIQITKE